MLDFILSYWWLLVGFVLLAFFLGEVVFELLFKFWWLVAGAALIIFFGKSLLTIVFIVSACGLVVAAIWYFTDWDLFSLKSSRRSSRRKSGSRRDSFFDDIDFGDD